MLNRRELLVGSAALGYLADAAPSAATPLLSAYYQRAHMYTIVPRHVREDLKWMAGIGTNVVCVAMLEQDLFAAIDNVNLISEEAAKAGLKVFAIPSRWVSTGAGVVRHSIWLVMLTSSENGIRNFIDAASHSLCRTAARFFCKISISRATTPQNMVDCHK
jgi:hypothetical protein